GTIFGTEVTPGSPSTTDSTPNVRYIGIGAGPVRGGRARTWRSSNASRRLWTPRSSPRGASTRPATSPRPSPAVPTPLSWAPRSPIRPRSPAGSLPRLRAAADQRDPLASGAGPRRSPAPDGRGAGRDCAQALSALVFAGVVDGGHHLTELALAGLVQQARHRVLELGGVHLVDLDPGVLHLVEGLLDFLVPQFALLGHRVLGRVAQQLLVLLAEGVEQVGVDHQHLGDALVGVLGEVLGQFVVAAADV